MPPVTIGKTVNNHYPVLEADGNLFFGKCFICYPKAAIFKQYSQFYTYLKLINSNVFVRFPKTTRPFPIPLRTFFSAIL